MFRGSYVAVVTPFTKDNKVDEGALEKIVAFHIANGTDGIVPCGTTGESATLDYAEHDRVIEICVRSAGKKVPVVAGTGSNSTQEAVEMSRHARRLGADGLLLVAPYYNRPTQEGLYRHFREIAGAVDLPIVLYNIPSRTGVNIEPETTARLAADCGNIIGMKEASGSLEQMARTRLLCGGDFLLLSGDDALTLPLMEIGGHGVISVVANIIPRDVKGMVTAFADGDTQGAQRLHYKMLPLIKAMFIETNPIPVKTAMGLMGLCEPALRLPMCPLSEANLAKLKEALKDYGLL
ncbi:MAG: 4-hydroxy-tetrahydrodipicolinate synthase [Deltaproteobacteria bacterium]